MLRMLVCVRVPPSVCEYVRVYALSIVSRDKILRSNNNNNYYYYFIIIIIITIFKVLFVAMYANVVFVIICTAQ